MIFCNPFIVQVVYNFIAFSLQVSLFLPSSQLESKFKWTFHFLQYNGSSKMNIHDMCWMHMDYNMSFSSILLNWHRLWSCTLGSFGPILCCLPPSSLCRLANTQPSLAAGNTSHGQAAAIVFLPQWGVSMISWNCAYLSFYDRHGDHQCKVSLKWLYQA